MIVKILKSFGGIDFDFQKDEIVELDDTTANYYISIGYAEAYTGGGGGTSSADWGSITGNIDNQLDLKAKFNGKVDKDGAKVLSTYDFNDTYKNKVDGSFQKSTDTSDNITEGSTKLLLTTTERTKIANAYIKGTDTSDSLTEGVTKLLMTTTERSKVANAFQKNNDNSDVITEGYANLFVTPAEKAKWNGNRTVYPVANNTERDALITNPPAGVTVQAGDKSFVVDDGDGKYAEYTYTGSMWLKTGDPDWANVLLDWANVVNKPSTIAGYGILDALQIGSTSSTAFRGDYGATAYTHSQIINGSNPHGTTFANIASKPTTIAGYGITDGAIQGTAYSNLENNVKIVQGVPAGGKMYLGATTQTGAIKIKLPKNKTNTMFKFHVRINGYSTGGKQSNSEYVVKGYNDILGFGNTTDTIATCQVTVIKDNPSNMSPVFYFCTGATEDYLIIGEITDTHVYKTVIVDNVEIHFNGIANDWSSSWAISLVTTLETLDSTKKVAVIPSLNATHLNGVQESTSATANTIVKRDATGRTISANGTSNGTIFSQTNTVTVTNTVSETSLIGTGTGSATIPANSLQAGSIVRVKTSGVITTGTSQQSTIKFKLGSTTLLTNLAALPNNLSNNKFEGTVDLLILTTGATGTAKVIGSSGIIQGNSTVFSRVLDNLNPVTIDTTQALTVGHTYTWTTASTGNSITTHETLIEKIN